MYKFKKSRSILLILTLSLVSLSSNGQLYNNSNNLAGWGMQVYKVDSSLYPFVSTYIRTYDGNQNPLTNVNTRNIGLLVKGRVYDPSKGQYIATTVKQAGIPTRTVILIDSSITMKGAPYDSALKATVNYIQEKEPNDQIAIVEMNDSKIGYSLVSEFTNDKITLASRLGGLQANALETRLFDSIGASLQLCRAAGGQGNSTEDATPFASCSLIVFSDGNDTGSALTRSDLMTGINNQQLPIPIHSLGFTKDLPIYLKNLQALSQMSFGRYFDASEALGSMDSVLRSLQTISKNDIVVTFRSYLGVDGEDHGFKVGVEYPSNSGSITYSSARFEANEALPGAGVFEQKEKLSKKIGIHESGNPHLTQSDPQKDN